MRLRLFLSFSGIVILTAVSVVAIASFTIGRDVRQFFQRGGLTGSETLVEDLERHYRDHRDWNSAGEVLAAQRNGRGGPGREPGPRPSGGSQGPVVLADAAGNVVLDTGPNPTEQTTLTEEQLAQELTELFTRGFLV